jgi:hypothetical protein
MIGDSQASPIHAMDAATSRLRASTCKVTAPASTIWNSPPQSAMMTKVPMVRMRKPRSLSDRRG